MEPPSLMSEGRIFRRVISELCVRGAGSSSLFWLTVWKLWMFLCHCAKLQAITYCIIQPKKNNSNYRQTVWVTLSDSFCMKLPFFLRVPLPSTLSFPSVHVLPFPLSLTNHSHPFKIVSGFCLWYFPSMRKRKKPSLH